VDSLDVAATAEFFISPRNLLLRELDGEFFMPSKRGDDRKKLLADEFNCHF
jgi:hypothetical protein